MMEGIFKLKAYARKGLPDYMTAGMPELPIGGQFLPMWTSPKPGGAGRGGQANFIFVEGRDLEFLRLLNPGPVQQWAIQPKNRSLYIIDRRALQNRVRDIKQQIKRAQKAGDRKYARGLARALAPNKAWAWCPSVMWPIIGIASKSEDESNVVMVERFVGKYAKIQGIPVGFSFNQVSYEETPWWVHKVYCGSRGRGVVETTPKGVFYMPIYSPIGRRGKGQEGIFILTSRLVIPE